MATRNQIKERSIEKVRRERAPVPWQYCLVSLACAVILAFGFFFAAKQHFSSIEFGMKNSDMRKAKEKLVADQRKLRAERDEVSSEANIEKAGLKIGLRKFSSDDYQFIDAVKNGDPSDNLKVADNKTKAPPVKEKTDAARSAPAAKAADGDKNQIARGKPETAKAVTKDTGRTLIAKK